jgi:hypothetical protein
MWSFIASWWWVIIVPGLVAISVSASVSAERQLSKEIDNNEKFARPDEQQVAWHVRHNREDIIYLSRLVYLCFFIVIVLIFNCKQTALFG